MGSGLEPYSPDQNQSPVIQQLLTVCRKQTLTCTVALFMICLKVCENSIKSIGNSCKTLPLTHMRIAIHVNLHIVTRISLLRRCGCHCWFYPEECHLHIRPPFSTIIFYSFLSPFYFISITLHLVWSDYVKVAYI